MKRTLLILALAAACLRPSAALAARRLTIDPAAIAEAIPLVARALDIDARARAREARHKAELARRGIAEVPPSKADVRYSIDTGGIGSFLFDGRGELYIDRRFVTDEEMKTVHAIERWIARYFPADMKSRKPQPRTRAGKAGLPVFRGFEDERYQKYDALIARMTAAFNADKATWCGGTAQQAAKMETLTPAMVKSHMIEESGGNDPRSLAAWNADPLQVNVPGDWGPEKELVGLKRPAKRNEGDVTNNMHAAIMYLSRKGFSASARPAASRPNGFFDGWLAALRRYNGRRDRTDTDRYYSDEYADKIIRRANNPDLFVPIEIKLKK